MNSPITDETLMAFADGVLDEPLFSQVAEAIEADEGLASRLEQLVDGAALARRGFEPLLEPVPAPLEASVKAAIAKAERPKVWRQNWNQSWLFPAGALAAIALAVVVAVPSFMGPANRGSGLAGLGSVELNAVLNTLPSGADQALPSGINIHTVATFTDAQGTLCREFETDGSAGYAIIACRSEQDWTIRLAVANSSTGEDYVPASGLAAVDAYLQSIGAGAPLLDQAEIDALGAGGDR